MSAHLHETLPRIPGVEIGEMLGQGAFGAVYRARHLSLDVDVAVKLVSAADGDSAAIERALYEARLMARLDHPNLLRIHDAGRIGSTIYLVLEVMDNSCATVRHAPPERALDLTQQLLSGLQALHDARVLHRDIKPANCLVRIRDGRVKLADLGIAVEQATRSDKVYETAGTLPFMAPELFDDPPRFSPASDLYALGLTLACMFLDADPYPSGSVTELLAWITGGARPKMTSLRPDLPPMVAALVERMIAPRSEDRPPSAARALASLGAITSPVAAVSAAQANVVIGPWVLGAQVYSSANWHGYAVTHVRTGVPARLSILQPWGPLADSTDLILAAAERASRLDHPGVLDVIDWGIKGERAYVVTPPQGRTIHSLVQSGGPRDELEAVEFAMSLAAALAYLHGRGLVYQLVEPGAAVITSDARSAQLSWPVFCVPIGTPSRDAEGKSQQFMALQYAAPEVFFSSKTIEPTVDLYGLGEIMYYMLAGKPAYAGATVQELGIAKAQAAADVRKVVSTMTAPTARLVAELTDPDPARRPASAAAVREELARIASRLRVGPPH